MNIIDADGHIVERDDDLRKYLTEPYSKRAGRLLPSDGLDTGLGGLVGGLLNNDIPTRLKDMDQEGIDVSVLFPTSSFAVNGLIRRRTTRSHTRALIMTSSLKCAGKIRDSKPLPWCRFRIQQWPSKRPTGR